MKTICLGILLVVILSCMEWSHRVREIDWVKQFNSAGNKTIAGKVITDRSGNIYSAGTFSDIMDFDPSPGVFTLSPAGTRGFISKLDSSGNFLWAKRLENLNMYDITTDKYKNLLIVGTFMGTVDIDPGVLTYTIGADAPSTCIVKLDPAGNFIWAKTFINNGYDDFECAATAIVIDQDQNIFTVGFFQGDADFDPDTSVFYLSSGRTWSEGLGSYPNLNSFFCKLDSNGKFLFAKTGDPNKIMNIEPKRTRSRRVQISKMRHPTKTKRIIFA